MIKLYPALTECEAVESHDFAGTLAAFFVQQGVDYRKESVQPVSISVNGVPIPSANWEYTHVTADDDLQIRLIPRGGIINFIRKIDPITNWLLKSMSPKTPQAGNTQSGASLAVTEATANVARLNEIVPELAGRYLRYPDYLTPPRRYFVNQREQWLEFLCCIGPGRYQITPEDVKIGETSFGALGADAEFTIFQPGQSLAGLPAQDIWHNSPEIGGTSSGTAGLDIPIEYTGTNDGGTVASEFAFNGNQITIVGEGHWAAGMRAGSRITDITLPLAYEVTSRIITPGELDRVNRFTGNFQEILPLAIGDSVNVSFSTPTGARIAAMELDASGIGWVELESNFGQPIDSVPTGTNFIAFKRANYYEVTAISGKTITVRKFFGSPNPLPVNPWLGFASVTSTSATITADTSSFAGDWTSLFTSTPKGGKTTATQIDFFFTGGLAHVSDTGEVEERTVQFEIQYRDKDIGGAFTSLTKTYTAATLDQIGFTETINHPLMAPEFHIRRLGVGSSSSSDYEKCQWYGMRAFMGVKQSYPNWTTMFVRIRSGGKVAANAENKINLIATRILPIIQFDESFGNPQPTRDISAFVRYIAQTIGYSDADIDTTELLRLHNIWTARGDVFDYVFDQTTVKDAINAALEPGMAEMTVDGGIIRPVRDEPRTVFEQPYSPQNMTTPLRRAWRNKRHEDPDGVEVEFMNAQTWTMETVMCLLPGDIGAKPTRIKVKVTDRTKAWRIGMRHRRALRYIVWSYQFGTEMDALNSRYLSYVPLIDNLKGYGQSAILEAITAAGGRALLTVSEPLEWQAGATHVVGYRRADGTMAGPYAADPGPDEFHLLADVPQPWPAISLKQEPPHIYFGTTEKWVFPALIKSIQPSGLDRTTVNAENYDARKYLDDDNAPD